MRREIAESVSAASGGSLNQRRMKKSLDALDRISQPRKAVMANRRRQREESLALEYEDQKVARAKGRVIQAFNGYDGFSIDVLTCEIAYLIRNGVDVTSILRTDDANV